MAEKRYAEGASLCREALEMKCNHAQLYLNLAELFHQEGRDREAMATCSERDSFPQEGTCAYGAHLKKWAGVGPLYCLCLDGVIP